ncbi:MAG: guanylate kinase, partial [Eubacteriales bacterium]|nr:guanylate kinase [Eubacteriales bacterium]
KKRILGRSAVDNLQSRLANAQEQLEHADDYTYIIVNDQKDRTLRQVETLVRAELINRKRNDNLKHAQKLVSNFSDNF